MREYRIVDPVMRTVEVFRLDKNHFGPADTYAFGDDAFVPAGITERLQIPMEDIFD